MSLLNFHYLCKYIIVGDSSVGKSNILLQFTQKKFKVDHEITIGVEFGARNLEVDQKLFRIQVWDTAGQETFRSITRAYYKNSVCAFLVYDITRRESFNNISTWYEECKSQSPKSVLIILVGNKLDLESQRQVKYEEGSEFAKKNDMLFFETSAKTSHNINEVFNASLCEINKKIQNGFYDLNNDNNGIKTGNNVLNQNISIRNDSISINNRSYSSSLKNRCC